MVSNIVLNDMLVSISVGLCGNLFIPFVDSLLQKKETKFLKSNNVIIFPPIDNYMKQTKKNNTNNTEIIPSSQMFGCRQNYVLSITCMDKDFINPTWVDS